MIIDRELRRYIFNYYGGFMTEEEMNTWEEIIEESKNRHYLRNRFSIKRARWNNKNKKLFYESVINRMLHDHGDEIFFNRCEICNVLARTPHAKICRNGHRKVDDIWVVMDGSE